MNMTIIGWVVNTILLAVAVFAVKSMLGGVNTGIKELKEHINTCVAKLEAEDRDIWKAVNTHGHKGLDQNGSKVTR